MRASLTDRISDPSGLLTTGSFSLLSGSAGGKSTFVGLDQAIDISYVSKNDETTRCNFCPNNCSRTFIDTKTLDGKTARYISGFSCEKGTVENMDDIGQIIARYKTLLKYIDKTPAADEARKDIALWESRQQQGVRKVGKEWLDADGLAKLDEQNLVAIEQARALAQQSKWREVVAGTDKVLFGCPLAAVILYHYFSMSLLILSRDTSPKDLWYVITCASRPDSHPPRAEYASGAAKVRCCSTTMRLFSFTSML